MATVNPAQVRAKLQAQAAEMRDNKVKEVNHRPSLDDKKEVVRVYKGEILDLMNQCGQVVRQLEDQQRREGAPPRTLAPWSRVNAHVGQIYAKLVQLGDFTTAEAFNARLPLLSNDVDQLHNMAAREPLA